MPTQIKQLTYEDYLNLPEIEGRYEIVDGEMITMAPGPTPKHQFTLRNAFLPVHRFVVDRQLGEVLFAPLDILIQRSPLRTRQPDLLFISKQRLSIIEESLITSGPDLVVEILSPANTRSEVENKLQDYWKVSVRECWLVAPEGRTVEVLKSSAAGFIRAGLYGKGDIILSEVLPELHLGVDEIFL